jgi:hypothetical protein
MRTKFIITALAFSGLAACSSFQYQPTEDASKFYADKLSCENQYNQGFNIWGNKVYGNIYKEDAARDCMLAKGYQIAK